MGKFVGIAGGSGAGKSTLAQLLAERLPGRAVVIEHDAYYRDQAHLPFAARLRTNYDHPDALETELLAAHLERLRAGEHVDAPQYDFVLHTRMAATRHIVPCELTVVEGLHVLHDPAVRRLLDLSVFLDLPAGLRFIRRARRDVRERGRSIEFAVTQYLATTRPMHLRFVAPARDHAGLVVDEHCPLPEIVERILALLSGAD